MMVDVPAPEIRRVLVSPYAIKKLYIISACSDVGILVFLGRKKHSQRIRRPSEFAGSSNHSKGIVRIDL